ncbi:hypothetical protein [Poriferisphaera sp. WC338]|uniref:hypothetical protein n=1 Tax=Poriferisphaera sp. WC338 TaxID=3425129 RepID=UPI003D817057
MNRFEALKLEVNFKALEAELGSLFAKPFDEVDDRTLECLKVFGIAYKRKSKTFMIRVRIPLGQMDTNQLRALAAVAEEYGQGELHLTMRSQIQVRGFQWYDLQAITTKLCDAGLLGHSTLMDSVRNIVTCPLTGISEHEYLDPTPVIERLNDRIVKTDELRNLPRKVNTIITGCLYQCQHAMYQDIVLLPAVKDIDSADIRGFNFYIGGQATGTACYQARPLDIFVSPSVADKVVWALLMLYRDHGSRDVRGECRISHWAEEVGLSEIREQLVAMLTVPLYQAGITQQSEDRCKTLGLIPHPSREEIAMGLYVPGAKLRVDDAEKIACFVDEFGRSELRLTPDQNIVVPGISGAKVEAAITHPICRTFDWQPHAAHAGTRACVGLPDCHLSMIDTSYWAKRVSDELQNRLPEMPEVNIRWSGCNAGCARHQLADIGLVGRKRTMADGTQVDAVDIYMPREDSVHHRLHNELVISQVPCEILAGKLEQIIRQEFMPPDQLEVMEHYQATTQF